MMLLEVVEEMNEFLDRKMPLQAARLLRDFLCPQDIPPGAVLYHFPLQEAQGLVEEVARAEEKTRKDIEYIKTQIERVNDQIRDLETTRAGLEEDGAELEERLSEEIAARKEAVLWKIAGATPSPREILAYAWEAFQKHADLKG